MEADGAVVIVMKIVFPRPQQFYRHADFLGDRGGFEHVIVGQAAAEAATGAAEMNRNVAFGDFQQLRHLATTPRGGLTG